MIDPELQLQHDELSSQERFRDACIFWTLKLAVAILMGLAALRWRPRRFRSFDFPKPNGDAVGGNSPPATGTVTRGPGRSNSPGGTVIARDF